MTKRAKTIIAVVLIVLSLAVLFTACNLKDAIDDLQQQVGGYEPNDNEKTVTIFIGEDKFEVTTSERYLHGALLELLSANKISTYDYASSDFGAYINQIEDLQQDFTNGKYYSIWHNVDTFALKSISSEWNPGRATGEDDGNGNVFAVTNYQNVKLYYSAVGVDLLPLIDGCTYAILVD